MRKERPTNVYVSYHIFSVKEVLRYKVTRAGQLTAELSHDYLAVNTLC